jgi:hypothetical protein
MEENIFNRLIYFDHNVFDLMIKGDPFGIKNFLKKGELIPVYSKENLAEIKRSTGYEDKFLDLLTEIEARHLSPILDEYSKQTGKANIFEGEPHNFYKEYLENNIQMPTFGYGLSGMLEKMYGGLEGSSFEEIFSKGSGELSLLLKEATESLSEEDLDENTITQIKTLSEQMPGILKHCYSDVAQHLDTCESESHVKELESQTNLCPKVLNNIKGPRVLEQIWDLLDSNFKIEGITLEKFFGIDQSDWQQNDIDELKNIDKVNAIYHQLNFLGYFRDSKMKKKRRFTASISDMTHAGLATFCKFFLCRDGDLVMKASAAFEYLKLNTEILYLKQS